MCSGCPIKDIVSQIKNKLPVTDISALQQIVKQRMYTISFVQKLVLTLRVVILLTACFMLALFMLTSVSERKKEIGILRSLGYTKLSVFNIFTFVAVLIGIASSIISFFGGLFSSRALLTTIQLSEEIHIKFNFTHLLLTIFIVSALTVVSSAFPSIKAADINPTNALTNI